MTDYSRYRLTLVRDLRPEEEDADHGVSDLVNLTEAPAVNGFDAPGPLEDLGFLGDLCDWFADHRATTKGSGVRVHITPLRTGLTPGTAPGTAIASCDVGVSLGFNTPGDTDAP